MPPRSSPALRDCRRRRADGASWPAEPFTAGLLWRRHRPDRGERGAGQYRSIRRKGSARVAAPRAVGIFRRGDRRRNRRRQIVRRHLAAQGDRRAQLESAARPAECRCARVPAARRRSRSAAGSDCNSMWKARGSSPKALVGSLTGNGTLSLERASIAGLDPRVFPTVMRAADRGLPIEPAKIRDAVAPWLDTGPLEIAHADGVLAIAGGQVRLPTMIARAKGADVSASGNLDLINTTLDARVALAGPAMPPAGRPEIIVSLRGPFAAPEAQHRRGGACRMARLARGRSAIEETGSDRAGARRPARDRAVHSGRGCDPGCAVARPQHPAAAAAGEIARSAAEARRRARTRRAVAAADRYRARAGISPAVVTLCRQSRARKRSHRRERSETRSSWLLPLEERQDAARAGEGSRRFSLGVSCERK